MLVIQRRRRRAEDGFTLVELLVTMLIVTVGLLGLAKLQATAVSNTSVSRTRALMTYQAESLAGMIRANKGFWATTGALPTWPGFSVSSAGVASDTGLMVAPTVTNCVNTTGASACTPQQLAYNDMYTWGAQFNDGTASSAFPNASATIVCKPATGTTCAASPTVPHGYDITLSWKQKIVGVNRSTVNSTPSDLTMVMHVQP